MMRKPPGRQQVSRPENEAAFRSAVRAFEMGDWVTAEAVCQQLLQSDKKDVNALQLLGRMYAQGGRYDEADSCYTKSLKYRPRDPVVFFLRAELCLAQGRADRAMDHLKKAIRLKPDFDAAKIQQAAVYERTGRYDEAKRILAGLSPRGKDVAYLARMRATAALHSGGLQEAVEIADSILALENIDLDSRRQLAFIRGQACDKLGDARGAMESWDLGNSLITSSFDPHAYRQSFEAELAFFSAATLEQLARATNESELPIFIAGMPRSGTTLVEQIIDAHPEAKGAGELADIERLPAALSGQLGATVPYPECLRALTTESANGLANAYLKHLARIGTRQTRRVVNKSLLNYRYLGLIALLFPRARVIYIWRNPVDVCLSIYMNQLHPTMHPYSTDLKHLGLAYRLARQALHHWQQVLDLQILEVEYESLIENPEEKTREIIEFTGLDWDDRCLRSHESGRTVMTLSYHQVSQPIYKSAVGRFERYREFLKPLFAELDMPA